MIDFKFKIFCKHRGFMITTKFLITKYEKQKSTVLCSKFTLFTLGNSDRKTKSVLLIILYYVLSSQTTRTTATNRAQSASHSPDNSKYMNII